MQQRTSGASLGQRREAAIGAAMHELDGPRLEEVRVLIVDDDRDVLESFDAAFQAEGALTMCARDGNEAVSLAQQHEPDLVVLDMMLPKRSGFLALERIKGREHAPLVIMVTANEGKRHAVYAESLGVDAYLHKPVPLAKLLGTAYELLKRADRLPIEEDDETGEGEPRA